MRKVLVLLLFIMSGIAVSAQMSDEKVIEYIKDQQAKGISQEQIVFDLNKKGVSMQQLQRMREKYDKQQSTGVLGNTTDNTGSTSRTRTRQSEGFNLVKPAEPLQQDKTVR